MALVLPRSLFLHVPKCAGWWVRNAISGVGIPTVEYGHEHTSFKSGLLRLRPPEWYRRKLVFMFVRHPLSWYQSMWAFRLKHGWSMTHPLDFNCASNNFEQFVRRAVAYCPEGWVTRTYAEYSDWVPEGVQLFVGRQESLQDDLLAALGLAGEEFDRDALLATPPANDSTMDGKRSAQLASYSDEVRQLVLQAESEVIKRWYPSNRLPDRR